MGESATKCGSADLVLTNRRNRCTGVELEVRVNHRRLVFVVCAGCSNSKELSEMGDDMPRILIFKKPTG